MNMTNENPKWRAFSNMIGRIMTYSDEDTVRLSTKKAIKSELWEYYNEYVDGDDYEKEETQPRANT